MKAIVTTDGKRIMARFPFAGSPGAWAVKVPGARKRYGEWTYPLTMDTCRAFRQVIGSDLEILPPLAIWARAEVEKERMIEQLREGDQASVDLFRVAEESPALHDAMLNRPFQINGAGFLLTGGRVILGDDPGLGKTLETLAALIEAKSTTILVGCRRTATRTVWERETLRWAPGIETFVCQGSRKEREAIFQEFEWYGEDYPDAPRMLIINIEMVRAKRIEICPETAGACLYGYVSRPDGHPSHKYEKEALWPFLFKPMWDAIVLDESHNLLASRFNYQSKNITQQRYGAVMLRRNLREDGLAIALSGTPFRSNLTKAWGTLNWVRPDMFPSFWNWAEKHFGVEDGKYGKVIAQGAKVPKPKDQDAWDAMLRPYYLKRTKADVVKDLPPIYYAGTPIDPKNPESPCYVQLDLTDEQARLYKQMESDAEINADGKRMTASGVLAEITRLRQIANASATIGEGRTVLPALPSNKLEWLVEFMQEREGTGAKVVVASSFTEIVELAASVLRKEGFEVLTLTGATSDRDRSDLVARFQDPGDSLQVVCLNRKAGGESITLDAADEMVVIDEPWISDDDEQLNARIHRVSRIHQVIVYRLVSAGTVDSWMAGLTEEQREAVLEASPRKLSEMVLGKDGD